MIKSKKLLKNNFQSEIDQFFHQFDKNRSEMPFSRLQEVRKHLAIFNKRDNKVEPKPCVEWKDF